MQIGITLKCSKCGEENYRTSKKKEAQSEKILLSKYCPRCKQHTEHKEIKK